MCDQRVSRGLFCVLGVAPASPPLFLLSFKSRSLLRLIIKLIMYNAFDGFAYRFEIIANLISGSWLKPWSLKLWSVGLGHDLGKRVSSAVVIHIGLMGLQVFFMRFSVTA